MNLTNGKDSTIINLISEITSVTKEPIKFRIVNRKNKLNRYIIFKQNSNIRDVLEISSENPNTIKWNGKTVSRNDFLVNYQNIYHNG